MMKTNMKIKRGLLAVISLSLMFAILPTNLIRAEDDTILTEEITDNNLPTTSTTETDTNEVINTASNEDTQKEETNNGLTETFNTPLINETNKEEESTVEGEANTEETTNVSKAALSAFSKAKNDQLANNMVFLEQSDTVTSKIRIDDSSNKTKYIIDITINEGAKGNQIIDIGKYAVEIFSKIDMWPGDSYKYSINITNNSGKKYKFKEDSFVLTTPNASSYEIDDNYNVIGFDGQRLPLNFISSRAYNNALTNLYGFKDLSLRHLLGVYDKLAKDGYHGKKYYGSEALTDFYLDYYNGVYKTNASSIGELPAQAISDIQGATGGDNGGSQVSSWVYISNEEFKSLEAAYPEIFKDYIAIDKKNDKSIRVQLKEFEPQLSALGYTFFYSGLLHCAFGNEKTTSGFLNKSPKWFGNNTSIASYMAGNSEISSSVNEFMKTEAVVDASGKIVGNQVLGTKDGSTMQFEGAFALDGPMMGNSYQSSMFAWHNTMILEEVKDEATYGSIDVSKTIDMNKVDFSQGDPIFIMKAENKETGAKYYQPVRFSKNGSATKTLHFKNLPIGNYEISEFLGIRYDFGSVKVSEAIANCATTDGEHAYIDLNKAVVSSEKASAHIAFTNTHVNDHYLSDTDTVVNRFHISEDKSISVDQDDLQ